MGNMNNIKLNSRIFADPAVRHKELVKLLKNPYFIRSIVKELLEDFNNEIVLKPRIYSGYGDYRRDSFLTGGAVAEKILEKIHGIKPVLNDIDIFYYDTRNQQMIEELYSGINNNEDYLILKSREFKKLNTIKILPITDAYFDWNILLDSFDLNYSQVGIILAENKLIYSPDFLDFLESKSIKIAENFDDEKIYNTLVRGFIKAKDLGLKFYGEESVIKELYNNNLDLERIKIAKSSDVDQYSYVSEKRLAQWEQYPDLIPNYKLIKEDNNHFIEVNISDPNLKRLVKLVVDLDNSIKIPFIHYLTSIKQLFTKAEINRIEKLLNIRKSLGDFDSHYFFYNFLCKDLIKNDLNLKNFEKSLLFFSDHKKIINIIRTYSSYKEGNSLEKIKTFEKFYSILSKKDIGLIGFIENLNENLIRRILETPEITVETFIQKLEIVYKKELSKNVLLTPEDKLVLGAYGRSVEEIIDFIRLSKESDNMRHCIRGYGSQLRNHQSRIFHLNISGNQSTLELKFKGNWYVQEHRAKLNQNPHKTNKQLARLLINKLNLENQKI